MEKNLEEEFKNYKIKSDFIETSEDLEIFLQVGIYNAKKSIKEMEKEKNINSIIITKASNKQLPLVQLTKLALYKKFLGNENTDKNVEPKNKNIKLPIHYSSKCIKRLEPLISTKIKEERIIKNRALTTAEKERICNKEIVDNFLYFFTCILLNYQEYIKVKYEKVKVPSQSNLDPNMDKDNIFKRLFLFFLLFLDVDESFIFANLSK